MERSLAETARHFFVKASSECPASITAQGALIASYCKKEGLQPVVLHQELLRDPDSLPFLKMIAERAHQSRGKGPSVVKQDFLREVIASGFKRADEYMILENDELKEIYEGIYPIGRDYMGVDEERIRLQASGILSRRLILVSPD